MAKKKKSTSTIIKKTPLSPTGSEKREVRFDYIKSNEFRVVHIDGAYGGVGPQGTNLQIAFYSERKPIPLQEVFEWNEDGSLGKKTETSVRQAIVREVEFNAVADLATAKRIVEWLNTHIKRLEDLLGKSK